MKRPILPSILTAVILSVCSPDQNDSGELMEPYFGQEPPGLAPEVFAPGIVPCLDDMRAPFRFRLRSMRSISTRTTRKEKLISTFQNSKRANGLLSKRLT